MRALLNDFTSLKDSEIDNYDILISITFVIFPRSMGLNAMATQFKTFPEV